MDEDVDFSDIAVLAGGGMFGRGIYSTPVSSSKLFKFTSATIKRG
jgi:hypothetical protein